MTSFVFIAEWIVWKFTILLGLAFYFKRHPDSGVTMLSKRYSMLLLLGSLFTVLTDYSMLHLLWWAPLAYLINMMVLTFSIGRSAKTFLKSQPSLASSQDSNGVTGDGSAKDFKRWSSAKAQDMDLVSSARLYIETFSLGERKFQNEPKDLTIDRAFHSLLMKVSPEDMTDPPKI